MRKFDPSNRHRMYAEIITAARSGEYHDEIAKRYLISRGMVSRIVRNANTRAKEGIVTPAEKLAKIKDILFKVEKDSLGPKMDIDHDAAGSLVGAMIDLKYHHKVPDDDLSMQTINNVMLKIEQVKDVINEPEAHLGDRFPHIVHHEEHQHDDSDGW